MTSGADLVHIHYNIPTKTLCIRVSDFIYWQNYKELHS